MTFFCQKICTCQKKAVLLHPLSKKHASLAQSVRASQVLEGAQKHLRKSWVLSFLLFSRAFAHDIHSFPKKRRKGTKNFAYMQILGVRKCKKIIKMNVRACVC